MVIVIGGGICGLSIGWYLARAGCPVTILEQYKAGRGATWASAGMLAPRAEAEPGEEWMQNLMLASYDCWPAFVHELEHASERTVDYRTEGTLVVALDRDDTDRLRHQFTFQSRIGIQLEWLSSEEVHQREPHLSRSVVAALFSPRDHQVDNRKVAIALRTAFVRAGGVLREYCKVDEIVIHENQVQGVRIGNEIVRAETVILAAGAWSATLGGLPSGLRPPVRPVKGQMLAIQMPPEATLLEHVVWGPGIYLVPRLDGRLLAGATVEEQGFDTQLTAGAIMDLLRRTWEVLPGVYDLPIVEQWAGLRPGSRDDAPILGLTDVRGLIMATGHYRNGILLAPITAETISQLVLSGTEAKIIKPFTIARFAPLAGA